MDKKLSTVRVAAVQHSPVVLNLDATVNKACGLIKEAAQNGAQLIVFPELFIPTYIHNSVWGAGFSGFSKQSDKAWLRLWENSVEIPGPATERLSRVCREAQAVVAIGVNERDHLNRSIYNTLLYFAEDGSIIGKHRKLMPTNHERLVHGLGDGTDLRVYNTSVGRIGGLICWENWMPLARSALYAQGEQIHVAPTAYDGELTITNIRNTAFEGGVFVVSVCEVLHKSEYPDDFEFTDELSAADDLLHIGGSAIAGPDGELLAGPVWNEPTILYADIDISLVIERSRVLDTSGHYSRPDVFKLSYPNSPKLK